MAKKIKTIKLYTSSVTQATFRKVSKKYEHLSEAQRLEVASDFGLELFLEEASKRVKEGSAAMLQCWDRESNTMMVELKVIKQKGELKIDLDTLKKSLGLNDANTDEIVSVMESERILKEDESFRHPLSQLLQDDDEPDFVNMYLAGSVMIDSIRNGSGKLHGNPRSAEKFLKSILLQLNPFLNVNKLIADVKMHRLSAMMKICNILGTADYSKLKNISL